MGKGTWQKIALATVVLALGGCMVPLVQRPHVTDYKLLKEDPGPTPPAELTARFLGTTTIILSDGRTSIMTDGFFSRPSVGRLLLRPVTPHEERIRSALKAADVRRVSAILVAHSHHDHAMDAPYVAQLTGADIVGSRSTANIALGAGFSPDRIRMVGDGWVCRFGAFTVTAFQTPHSGPMVSPGVIARPLARSAWVEDYREGGNFTFHVAHTLGNVLIVSSRGVREGWSVPLPAKVVFLGMGGRVSSEAQLRDYWDQFVLGSGATTVYPIHWDNFFAKFERADVDQVPKPLRRKMTYLRRVAAAAKEPVMVETLPYADKVVLSAGPGMERKLGGRKEAESCLRPRS